MGNGGRDNARDPDLAAARSAATDPDAFGMIYERHAARIYAYAIQRLHDSALAEDATATTFARALAAIDRFEPRERGRAGHAPTVGGWLLTIARNVVIDLATERRVVALDIAEYAGRLVSREPGPARMAELSEDRRRILAALGRLPETQQRIVLLRFQGWKGPEIAELLGTSPGAVRVAQHRAFTSLRAMLEPDEITMQERRHG